MKPQLVPGVSNIQFEVPGAEGERALLPAQRITDDGDHRISSRWVFEHADELAALAAGGVLELLVYGERLPATFIDVVPPHCATHGVEKEMVRHDGLLGVEYRCPMCDFPAGVATSGEPDDGGTPVAIWAIEQDENPEETEVRCVTCRPCSWATFATDAADAQRRAQLHINTDRHQAAKGGT